MKLNKNNIFLTMLSLSIFGTKSVINNHQNTNNTNNNTNLLKVITNEDTRMSLSSMFINDKLENIVDVRQASKLDKITDFQIKDAITQEVLSELSTKTNDGVIEKLDYNLSFATINNEPVPLTNNLNNPFMLKVTIVAKDTSKVLKDKITLTCNVDYPIFNFNEFLKAGLKELYGVHYPGEYHDIQSIDFNPTYNKTELSVNNAGQPILNKNIPTFSYFVGESILENNDDYDQTIPTPSWSKSINNETSLTISTAASLGLDANFDCFGLKWSLKFDEQKTSQKGTSQQVSVTPIPVFVKAHHKIQVLVYLNAFVSIQNITMDSDISGNVSGTFHLKGGDSAVFTASIKDIIKYHQDIGSCPRTLTIKPDNQTVLLRNEAMVSKYDVGTLWRVIINPLN